MKKLRIIKNHRHFNKASAGIGIALFAIVGTVLLFRSHAATPYASVEPENGTLSRTDLAINDTTASGGRAVQFKAAGTTPPAQCNSGGAYLWSNLELCGWPGPANTGYPAGQVFTNTSGRTVTTNDAVISGEKITGQLIISAQRVKIQNSWVVNSSNGAGGTNVIEILPGASATIENTTIFGSDNTHMCVYHTGASVTLTAVNCYGVNDGFFAGRPDASTPTGNNFTIENSYFHDFTQGAANGHIDGFQTEGASGGIIMHNTIKAHMRPGDPTVTGGGVNSSVAIWDGQRNSDNILVDNNLLAGGGFTAYAEDYSPSEDSAAGGFTVTNIRFTNNKFSTYVTNTEDPGGTPNCVGFYGVWFFRSALIYQGGPTGNWGANGNIRTGNTILETGFNLDSGNPPGCS